MVMTSTISLVLEVMSSTPVCVQRQTALSELLELFDRFDYNAFPVVEDPSTNVLEGIVTKLDVLRALRSDQAEREVMKIEVGEIMRPGVVNIEGDIPIDVAADL
ncbi:MAG TPA: CBS domain-containing protein, partial [Gemmatimonadaceae bacterium]